MRIAIVGARLAGSYVSLLLSRMGHEVLLFDDTTRTEKPCGGGVTPKALRNVSWFHENPLPHTEIQTVRMIAPGGYTSDLPLRHPIQVFSRITLDSALLQCAIESGTRFLPERALGFIDQGAGWAIKTASGTFEIDFLIGADGAKSSTRAALVGKFAPADLTLAVGYYLPGLHHPDTLLVVFQEGGFRGYMWSFPRLDHSSVGVGRWLPETNAADLRHRVEEFVSIHYPSAGLEKRFYAARIPCLSRRTLLRQRVCGKNWALLGDAAGFADAITAEGIYFALRSAELLAESFRRGEPSTYENEWRLDFGAELLKAAEWRDRFYAGTFILRAFTGRTVQFIRHSPAIQQVADSLICGSLSYEGLRRRLILQIPRVLIEAIRSRIARGKPACCLGA